MSDEYVLDPSRLDTMDFEASENGELRIKEWRATMVMSNKELWGTDQSERLTMDNKKVMDGMIRFLTNREALLQEAMRKNYEAEAAAKNAKATDPFSVACPVCCLPRGTKCTDARGVLIGYHHARHIKATKQAKSRKPELDVDCPACGAMKWTDCWSVSGVFLVDGGSHEARKDLALKPKTGTTSTDVDCVKCGAKAGWCCVDTETGEMSVLSHPIRYRDAARSLTTTDYGIDYGCLKKVEKPTPAAGQVWKHPHQTGQLRIVGRNGDGTSWRAAPATGFWCTGEEWLLTDEWFQKAELVSEPETPNPAVGQVWRGKHKGAANVELVRAGPIYHSFEAKLITSGSILEAYPVMDIGFTFWATKGWFKNATLVREAKNGTKKNTGHSLDKRKQQFAEQWRDNPPALPPVTLGDLAIDSVTPIAPPNQNKIEFISGSDVKVTAPVRVTINRIHCAWCGTETDGHLTDGNELPRPFCCNVHKSEYENNPGGSWLAEMDRMLMCAVRDDVEKALQMPLKETVTVAGITMDKARYEERCRAYDGYAAGKLGRYVVDANAGSLISKMTRMPGTLEHSSFNNPNEPEPGHPWTCDDADYVVMG